MEKKRVYGVQKLVRRRRKPQHSTVPAGNSKLIKRLTPGPPCKGRASSSSRLALFASSSRPISTNNLTMLACKGDLAVNDSTTLLAAVTDSSPRAPCRILLASSEYALANTLAISRSVQVISVLAAGHAVLRAVPAHKHHVLSVSAGDVVLDGVAIVDGGAVVGGFPDNSGGGMLVAGGNVTLLNSIVANNTATVRPPPASPRAGIAMRPRRVLMRRRS